MVARIAILSAAYFYVMSNIALIISILPFMARDMQVDQLQATLLLSIFPVVSLPANLVLGALADRVGRRQFLMTGSWASAILFALSSCVTTAWEGIILRGVIAIFTSMIACSIFSSIRDYFSSDDSMKATGYVSAAASVAQLLGVPLIVLCAESLGWRVSFLALSAYGCLLALLITRLPKPEYAVSQAGQERFRSELVRMLEVAAGRSVSFTLIGYALYTCGTFVFLALYPTWLLSQASHFSTGHDVSLVLFSGGLGSFLGAIAVGAFGARFASARGTCPILCALTAVPIAAVPFVGTSIEAQVAAYGMMCVFRAMLVPIVINGTMAAMPPRQRGTTNGILASIFQTGTAVGGTIGVQLYAADTAFGTNAITAFAFLLVAVVSFAARPITST